MPVDWKVGVTLVSLTVAPGLRQARALRSVDPVLPPQPARSAVSTARTATAGAAHGSTLGSYDPRAVPDVLIYAGTIDPAMRHEVPIGIPDPFLYVERGGERHVVLTSFEIDRVNAIAGGPTPHPYEEFGYDELLAQGLTREEVYIRVAIARVQALRGHGGGGAGDLPGDLRRPAAGGGRDARPRSTTSSTTGGA